MATNRIPLNTIENPIWVAPAYKKNQSKTILAKSVYEDEAEAYRESKKQRRQ